MREPFQRDFPHTLQQLAERHLTGQIRPQCQCVQKQSGQTLNLGSRPPGHGRPRDNVILPAIPVQQRLKGGQQQHEQRHVLPPTECLESRA